MADDVRTINARHDSADLPRRLAAMLDRPIAEATVAAGVQAGDVRRLTITVRDRLGAPWAGRWLIAVWVSTTAGGAPGGTQSLTMATGTLVDEPISGKFLWALTDLDGEVEIDVDSLGNSGDRYFTVLVIGKGDRTAAVAFA